MKFNSQKNNYEIYYKYLKKRSKLGLFYRKNYLYPKLEKKLIKPSLDVGCGIGDMITFSNKVTHGIDINENLVKYCKNNGQNVFLIKNFIYPFEDNSFNSIILDNVLEHLENPEKTINEIKRVLKFDGIILIGVPGHKGYLHDQDHKIFYDDKKIDIFCKMFNLILKEKFSTPFSLDFLENYLKIYCRYYVLINKK